tara:strand:+ start:214 stop:1458 length:1245 start_codon:yes stop_codon:yes gene_type:complete
MSKNKILTWQEISNYAKYDLDRINGETNSYSSLRLFNKPEDLVEVILYRDRHAWCPYCQKVWLWLEFKKIPYSIKKVNMFCYGKKETWFLQKVPSGKVPVIELKGKLITESDQIIDQLEKEYGFLGQSLNDPKIIHLRKIERAIFRDWCNWLCRKSIWSGEREKKIDKLYNSLKIFEEEINSNNSCLINTSTIPPGNNIGTGDIIFIPYIERINASLAYYKGFNLRKEFPGINKWLSELEKTDTYRGTQGDFHTHAHDLPPQMGICIEEKNQFQTLFSSSIDSGNGLGEMEFGIKETLIESNNSFEQKATQRVFKHKKNILRINPLGEKEFDQPLRTALTNMLLATKYKPEKNSALGLRYLKDRISVPRDMPLLSARLLRKSLEMTASLDSNITSDKLSKENRFDQNPANFFVD